MHNYSYKTACYPLFSKKIPFQSISLMAGLLALCVLIKYFFTEADALQLDWLLRPTSSLVSFFSGLHFVSMDVYGYYNDVQRVLIAPSCSGLNFFLILLATGGCLVVFSLHRQAKQSQQVLCFIGVAGAAYGITLIINTVRILLAIFLYQHKISLGPFNPERLHRIEGIVIYYVCLCCFVMLLSYLLGKIQRRKQMDANIPAAPSLTLSLGGRILLPLSCYLFFTLAIPLINGAALKTPRIFAEHSLTVLLCTLACSLGLYFALRPHKRFVLPPQRPLLFLQSKNKSQETSH